jgi:predicted nucleotidyltransferase
MIDPRHLESVRRIVLEGLGDRPARLFLFGSHARGDARIGSDIDVAILPAEPVPPAVLARIREALEESRVPYQVDLVDLARAEEDFVKSALRGAIAWTV